MSSKRGRKRNDNLPPNRARDVQRAFRARRAAHLQALEQRVTELEEENSCLRQALSLPPANRAPLGKGPTGKDKPKTFDSGSSRSHFASRDSSVDPSPSSTRTSSLSPSAITGAPMRTSPRDVQSLEAPWDHSLVMPEQQSDVPVSAGSSSSYQLPPVSAPLPTKSPHYPPYPTSIPSSRNSLPSNMYMNPQHNYTHSAERNVGGNYGNSAPAFLMRSDTRDEPRQPQYSYTQPSFTSHDGLNNAPHTAPLRSHNQQRETSLPFPHRRSLTETQTFHTIVNQFPHLPDPHQSHGIRLPSPPRLQESAHAQARSTGYGANDGRLQSLS